MAGGDKKLFSERVQGKIFVVMCGNIFVNLLDDMVNGGSAFCFFA